MYLGELSYATKDTLCTYRPNRHSGPPCSAVYCCLQTGLALCKKACTPLLQQRFCDRALRALVAAGVCTPVWPFHLSFETILARRPVDSHVRCPKHETETMLRSCHCVWSAAGALHAWLLVSMPGSRELFLLNKNTPACCPPDTSSSVAFDDVPAEGSGDC